VKRGPALRDLSAWRLAALACGLSVAAGPAWARPLPSAGARAMALGNAAVADPEDVNILFYNPAGLTAMTGPELALNYGRLDFGAFQAATEGHAAFGVPTEAFGIPMSAAGGFMAQSLASGVHRFDLVAAGGLDVPHRGLLPWPLKGGAALKIRHQNGHDLDPAIGKSAISAGLDLGAFVPFTRGSSAGLVIRDLFAGDANPAGAQLRVGGRHTFASRAMIVSDVEIRKNVAALHLGTEWFFCQRLLRLRAGNGFRSGGIDHVALGAGFNFSPAQFDVAYMIPLRTFNDPSDQFRVSFIHRFAAPKFSELYLDRALDKAEELDRRIAEMEKREAELKGKVDDLEQARRLAEEGLARSAVRRVEGDRFVDEHLIQAQNRAAEAEERARALEEKVRRAEEKIRRAERLEKAGPRGSAPAAAAEPPRPKTHVVQPGETLQSIAEKYYKDANRWRLIYNANPDKVSRGRPVAGATLVIP
jgi:LysM repeat protein